MKIEKFNKNDIEFSKNLLNEPSETILNTLSSNKLKGLICNFLNDYYLLDFENNQIFKLKNNKFINGINGTTNESTKALFEKDSAFFIASGNNLELREYNLNISDFEATNYKIYKTSHTKIYIIFFNKIFWFPTIK